ncbi:sulfatase, partial [Candidatus Altiarchaeota archaeon]
VETIKKVILPLFILYSITALIFIPYDEVRFRLTAEKFDDLKKNPLKEIPHTLYLIYGDDGTLDDLENLSFMQHDENRHVYPDNKYPLVKISRKKLCEIEPSSCDEEQPVIDLQYYTQSTTSPFEENNTPPLNIIFLVFESTRPDALSLYGGSIEDTPNLEKVKKHSVAFENFYSTAALSARSMPSILCSIYPYFRADMVTLDRSDINLLCLSDILKKNDYRTAVFHSGSLNLAKELEFLDHRSFDILYTRKNISPTSNFFSKPAGYEDLSVVKPSFDWIDKNKEKPFFIYYYTVITHMPYTVPEEYKIRGGDNPHSQYLNTIYYQDHFFGEIWNGLGQRNLTDKTLIVIVGDHGQAFLEHDVLGHGAYIYEEFIRVPFILLNPVLFRGEHISDRMGQTVDVVPTVLDILEIDVINPHQGRSLLQERENKTIFFVSGEGLVTGLREGRYKFIHNSYNRRKELFDLENDPEESTNLAYLYPEKIREYDALLSSFKAAQNTLLKYDRIWYPQRDES